MPETDVLVIGAGQAGLASSVHLERAGIDHLLLERGEVANSWREERWDSLRLLSPNWHSRLPGFCYDGDDPDGYMTAMETVAFLSRYASKSCAPVQSQTTVNSLKFDGSRFVVDTNRGRQNAKAVILATGACNTPNVPRGLLNSLPSNIQSLSPLSYKNPNQVSKGRVLVVGASASGIQIAHELASHGRDVTVAVGRHIRAPRVWRGKDIIYWFDRCGVFDTSIDDVADVLAARKLPSVQLAGTPQKISYDLNSLQTAGVSIVGRLNAIVGTKAFFDDSLEETVRAADTSLYDLLAKIDAFAISDDLGEQTRDVSELPKQTRLPAQLIREIDLVGDGYSAVIWATGYRPDMSWVSLPVFHRETNAIMHDKGSTPYPGLYVLGLPFLRKRKSNFIDGVGEDAKHVVDELRLFLNDKALVDG